MGHRSREYHQCGVSSDWMKSRTSLYHHCTTFNLTHTSKFEDMWAKCQLQEHLGCLQITSKLDMEMQQSTWIERIIIMSKVEKTCFPNKDFQ